METRFGYNGEYSHESLSSISSPTLAEIRDMETLEPELQLEPAAPAIDLAAPPFLPLIEVVRVDYYAPRKT